MRCIFKLIIGRSLKRNKQTKHLMHHCKNAPVAPIPLLVCTDFLVVPSLVKHYSEILLQISINTNKHSCTITKTLVNKKHPLLAQVFYHISMLHCGLPVIIGDVFVAATVEFCWRMYIKNKWPVTFLWCLDCLHSSGKILFSH